MLQSRALPLTRFLLEQRFQSSRHQRALTLGEMAAMQVPGHDKGQRRTAFAGVVPEARRHASGQASQVTVSALKDFALVEYNLLLQTVYGNVAAEAVEFRMTHGREELGIRVDRQTLFRHGNLR